MHINEFTIFTEDAANDFARVRVNAVGEKWGKDAVNHESFNGYAVGFDAAEEKYKNLLYKYMKVVSDATGVDYLRENGHIKNLTPVELKTLQDIANMI